MHAFVEWEEAGAARDMDGVGRRDGGCGGATDDAVCEDGRLARLGGG